MSSNLENDVTYSKFEKELTQTQTPTSSTPPAPPVQTPVKRINVILPAKPERLQVIFVGKAGAGKTAIQKTLLERQLQQCTQDDVQKVVNDKAFRRLSSGASTIGIDEGIPEVKIELMKDDEIRNVVNLKMVDVEGYGESAHLEINWKMIMDFIHLKQKQKDPVHVVVFLLDPFRFIKADKEFLQLLSENMNVIPLISKCDTMNPKQKTFWQTKLFELLVDSKINFHRVHPSKILCVAGSETGSFRDYSFAQNVDITSPHISDIAEFENLFFGQCFWEIRSQAQKFQEDWQNSSTWLSIVKQAPVTVVTKTSKFIYYIAVLIAVIFAYLFGKISAAPRFY